MPAGDPKLRDCPGHGPRWNGETYVDPDAPPDEPQRDPLRALAAAADRGPGLLNGASPWFSTPPTVATSPHPRRPPEVLTMDDIARAFASLKPLRAGLPDGPAPATSSATPTVLLAAHERILTLATSPGTPAAVARELAAVERDLLAALTPDPGT